MLDWYTMWAELFFLMGVSCMTLALYVAGFTKIARAVFFFMLLMLFGEIVIFRYLISTITFHLKRGLARYVLETALRML